MSKTAAQAAAAPASVVLVALLAAGAALAQGGPTVDWWVIVGGGGPSGGGDVTLNDTLGQPVIGPATADGLALSAGYWARARLRRPPCPRSP